MADTVLAVREEARERDLNKVTLLIVIVNRVKKKKRKKEKKKKRKIQQDTLPG